MNGVEKYEALLTEQTKNLGPDHPDTLAARGDLAGAHHEAGHLSTAIDMHQAVLPDMTRVLGPNHPKTRAISAELTYLKNEKWRRENRK